MGFLAEHGETGEVIDRSLRYVLSAASSGRNVVLVGYPLGKAQILTKLFSWYNQLIVDERVERYNRVYEKLGIDLGYYIPYREALRGKYLEGDGWLMISSRGRVEEFAREHDALIVEFTGWAKNPGYRYWSNVDAAFPLSDHADFRDLLRIVEETQPSEVYVAYGFSKEFSLVLREKGFKAVPLIPNQREIVDF